MDLVRLPALKQVALRLSAEGGRVLYLAQDRATGRIFTLPAKLAHALRLSQQAVNDPAQATQVRERLDEDQAREAFGFLHMVRSARATDLLRRKPFNPLFANIPLFDPSPVQRYLEGVARLCVGPQVFGALFALALLCFLMGVQNDWAIAQEFERAFSIEALLSFGLIAPVLKVIHELGHVLAATRYGVRVKQAGIMLVGLYPMPFVDVTDADMTAPRRARIAISLAGIVTDLFIGGLAFVAWHLTEGSYFHVLLGNIVVFSTLNSILFNANPLIKLDGYYALFDALGMRNFYTRSASMLKDVTAWFGSFGQNGALPRSWGQAGMLGYALGTLVYRLNILWIIAAGLMPKYLGGGVLLTLWGALVMFVAPMMRAAPSGASPDTNRIRRRAVWWGGLTAMVAVLGLWVQWSFSVVVPVSVDTSGRYQMTARSSGHLEAPLHSGLVEAGAVLVLQDNSVLRDDLAILAQEMIGAEAVLDSVRGEDPAKAKAAQDKIISLTERQHILEGEITNLRLVASHSGLFVPMERLQLGQWLNSGQSVGAFLPDTGHAHLTGDVPERYVTLYQASLQSADLKIGKTYQSVDIAGLELREVMQLDRESGTRSWQLTVQLPNQVPSQMLGQPGHIRLRFERAPAWRHALFWWQGVIEKYREAQMLDRANFLQ